MQANVGWELIRSVKDEAQHPYTTGENVVCM